jgi:succinyl-diaminopimelate desuccinylase
VLVETSGNSLKIRATGISAHASKPNEGVSAVALLCDALKHIAGLGAQMKVVDAIGKLAHDSAGSALGIACSDTVCGALTSNLGVLRFDSGDTPRLTASFSVRYPVTASWDELLPKLETAVNAIGFSLVSCSNSNPLYLPATDPLIETLISVYRSETADDQTPLQTMGGGTYARMLKHGVAFGPDFPGTPGLAHKVDESWSVDQLMTSTRIYARAIARIGLQP